MMVLTQAWPYQGVWDIWMHVYVILTSCAQLQNGKKICLKRPDYSTQPKLCIGGGDWGCQYVSTLLLPYVNLANNIYTLILGMVHNIFWLLYLTVNLLEFRTSSSIEIWLLSLWKYNTTTRELFAISLCATVTTMAGSIWATDTNNLGEEGCVFNMRYRLVSLSAVVQRIVDNKQLSVWGNNVNWIEYNWEIYHYTGCINKNGVLT